MTDVYDRIDEELEKRKMSRRKLAIRAGMPESTIAALFARRSKGISFSTLNRIANALNLNVFSLAPEWQDEVILDTVNRGDMNNLVAEYYECQNAGDRNELGYYFNRLNEKGREMLMAFAAGLNKLEEYRTSEEPRDQYSIPAPEKGAFASKELKT